MSNSHRRDSHKMSTELYNIPNANQKQVDREEFCSFQEKAVQEIWKRLKVSEGMVSPVLDGTNFNFMNIEGNNQLLNL